VESGLLAGTFREHLLKTGEIEEQQISIDDLKAAHEIFLINSIRRWRRARF
jgi:para-aminobenzoate synthetase/4-amino-4-deoxychorismate lyase